MMYTVMKRLFVTSDGFRSGLLSVYFYLLLSVYFEEERGKSVAN